MYIYGSCAFGNLWEMKNEMLCFTRINFWNLVLVLGFFYFIRFKSISKGSVRSFGLRYLLDLGCINYLQC